MKEASHGEEGKEEKEIEVNDVAHASYWGSAVSFGFRKVSFDLARRLDEGPAAFVFDLCVASHCRVGEHVNGSLRNFGVGRLFAGQNMEVRHQHPHHAAMCDDHAISLDSRVPRSDACRDLAI